jgi:4-hydroxybenzoyl-CoA thioesterase
MSRIKLELPAQFPFSTEVEVRIGDINYGQHLGNDAVLSFAHEARIRFLKQHGFTEANVAGAGMLMVDAVVVYKSQSFHGDVLKVEVAVADIGRTGCDFLYRLTNRKDGKEIARVKTGVVFFDYAAGKIHPVPEAFRKAVGI